MSLGLKIVLSVLLLGTQAAVIFGIRRLSTQTLVKWRFFHFRGEEMWSVLRQAGDEMRQGPERWRGFVLLIVVCCTLPLDVLLAAIWLQW